MPQRRDARHQRSSVAARRRTRDPRRSRRSVPLERRRLPSRRWSIGTSARGDVGSAGAGRARDGTPRLDIGLLAPLALDIPAAGCRMGAATGAPVPRQPDRRTDGGDPSARSVPQRNAPHPRQRRRHRRDLLLPRHREAPQRGRQRAQAQGPLHPPAPRRRRRPPRWRPLLAGPMAGHGRRRSHGRPDAQPRRHRGQGPRRGHRRHDRVGAGRRLLGEVPQGHRHQLPRVRPCRRGLPRPAGAARDLHPRQERGGLLGPRGPPAQGGARARRRPARLSPARDAHRRAHRRPPGPRLAPRLLRPSGPPAHRRPRPARPRHDPQGARGSARHEVHRRQGRALLRVHLRPDPLLRRLLRLGPLVPPAEAHRQGREVRLAPQRRAPPRAHLEEALPRGGRAGPTSACPS